MRRSVVRSEDPFGPSEPEEERGEQPGRRRRRKFPPARKLAYAAIGAALSVVMIAIAAWLPVTVAPLVLVSISWNVVAEKCGPLYGLLSMAAGVTLGFLCSAANIAMLVLVAVVFVPYSLFCMLAKRLDYRTLPKSVVRILLIAAFAALEVLIVYNLGNALVGVNDYIDIARLISAAAGGNFALGYAMITLIAVLAFVLIDFVYVYFSRRILSKLK